MSLKPRQKSFTGINHQGCLSLYLSAFYPWFTGFCSINKYFTQNHWNVSPVSHKPFYQFLWLSRSLLDQMFHNNQKPIQLTRKIKHVRTCPQWCQNVNMKNAAPPSCGNKITLSFAPGIFQLTRTSWGEFGLKYVHTALSTEMRHMMVSF